jgi:hypothetical protein
MEARISDELEHARSSRGRDRTAPPPDEYAGPEFWRPRHCPEAPRTPIWDPGTAAPCWHRRARVRVASHLVVSSCDSPTRSAADSMTDSTRSTPTIASTTLGPTVTAVLAGCRAEQTMTEGRCVPGS